MGMLFLVLMLAGVGISIAVHEAGHMYAARIYKGKVSSFSVGFGPTLARYTRNNTLYTFKLIPLYGYVRIEGMDQDGLDVREPGYTLFRDMKTFAKTVVLIGGVTLNALLALILSVVSLSAIGVDEYTSTIDKVSKCAVADQTACAESGYGPAFAAGVAEGSVIRSVDGKAVEDWSDLVTIMKDYAPGDTVSMVVVNGEGAGESVSITLAEHPNIPGRGYLGLTPLAQVRRYPVSESAYVFKETAIRTVGVLLKYPVTVYTSFEKAVTGDTSEDPDLLGPVGLGRLGAGIGTLDSSLGQRFGMLLSVLAAINISLAVFNTLPLLPFDGGRIVLVWLESLRTRVYRMRGVPNPGPFSPRLVGMISAFVVGAYIVSALMLLVVDLVNPLTL